MKSERPTRGIATEMKENVVPEGWSVADFDPDFNKVNNYRPWCSEGRIEGDDGTP